EQTGRGERDVELSIFGNARKLQRARRSTVDRHVIALAVEIDLIGRNVCEDSGRGRVELCYAGELRQLRLICKSCEPFELHPIAAELHVERFRFRVVLAAADN